MSLNNIDSVKALGINWDPRSDSIFYSVKSLDTTECYTKRSITSKCAKLFDPTGLVGPVIVVGKMLIQDIWKLQLGWDDVVPNEILEKWLVYKNQLPLINNLRFQRCLILESSIEFQIHGFCDASEKAYGACFYLLSIDSAGKIHCELICSKSRVAPLKTISLPRLELCSAVLLIQLYKSTVRALKMKISKSTFWSDSTITLNWINTEPHKLLTFVANRVSEIQSNSQSADWRHVPSQDNPADCLSRGQLPNEFLENDLWVHGPQWLKENEQCWPKFEFKGQEILEKRTKTTALVISLSGSIDLLEKYSKLKKLQRIFAYCLRFINNLKIKDQGLRKSNSLSNDELHEALRVILKLVQAQAFSKEILSISKNKCVDSKSSLLNLNPFLEEGLLKVGGRLDRAEIPESQKHPIVLPKGHHVTKLIIQNEHIKRSHAGTNATLYGVRENYWPIDGRNVTRQIVRKCITCFRVKPREVKYLMGNLPKTRLSLIKPFLNVGIDFCGPFFVKEHRHRNRTKVKTYVSVFVCFATKAVHLELASDLSTEAFLSCLKRFFARRGLSQSINSDNATNFVGTNNEIKGLMKHLSYTIQEGKVKNYLLEQGVIWRFIPPRAPHFGGLWEAAVKSFKYHFTRIAGNTLLTYEQLHTYVVEVEGILNSRPLTPLSSDPNDLLPLTPAHFLIGSSMTSLPSKDLRQVPAHRLNCWQLAQQMRQHFWSRWSKEYLNELLSRGKWQTNNNQDNVACGTLVVVKEDNLPPLKWSLARIIETHPGRDGIVRTVTLKTVKGTYTRALKNVYPLPLE